MQKKIIWAFFISLLSTNATLHAQDLTGIWQQIDDKTGSPKALIEIQKDNNGSFSGKIKKITPRAGYTPKEKCINCPAPYTNKPIIGMQVISGLKTEDQINYTNGKIIDPVSGKFYRLKGKISTNGKKLFLRGYMGVSAVGRSQTWLRVE